MSLLADGLWSSNSLLFSTLLLFVVVFLSLWNSFFVLIILSEGSLHTCFTSKLLTFQTFPQTLSSLSLPHPSSYTFSSLRVVVKFSPLYVPGFGLYRRYLCHYTLDHSRGLRPGKPSFFRRCVDPSPIHSSYPRPTLSGLGCRVHKVKIQCYCYEGFFRTEYGCQGCLNSFVG